MLRVALERLMSFTPWSDLESAQPQSTACLLVGQCIFSTRCSADHTQHIEHIVLQTPAHNGDNISCAHLSEAGGMD